MEEDRRVLERLRRIELLEQERAPAEAILAEVRELIVEAEAWLRSGPPASERARDAIDACREALDERSAVAA